MKTILVPVDFSSCAVNAYHYALNVAEKTGASIHVLHVIFPNEGVDNNIYNAFWIDDYMKQREKELKNWIRRRKPAGLQAVPVTCACTVGFPVPSISEAAEEKKTDVIIMGTTGATGLRGAFLGSVASGVLSRTTLPVLVVPKKAGFKTGTDTVFATDYNLKVFSGALEVLRTLVKISASRLQVVHILDKPGEKPDIHREATLKTKLGEIAYEFHYLHDKDVPQAVSNFIDSVDAGLLVSVAHHHNLLHRLFYDSVTRRLAHRTHVPLLVLHDADAV